MVKHIPNHRISINFMFLCTHWCIGYKYIRHLGVFTGALTDFDSKPMISTHRVYVVCPKNMSIEKRHVDMSFSI